MYSEEKRLRSPPRRVPDAPAENAAQNRRRRAGRRDFPPLFRRAEHQRNQQNVRRNRKERRFRRTRESPKPKAPEAFPPRRLSSYKVFSEGWVFCLPYGVGVVVLPRARRHKIFPRMISAFGKFFQLFRRGRKQMRFCAVAVISKRRGLKCCSSSRAIYI